MIPILIAVSHAAGGKSTFLRFAKQGFQSRTRFPAVVSDRELLAQAVQRDHLQYGSYDTKLIKNGKERDVQVTPHAVIFKGDPDVAMWEFTVRDGSLLNRVHEQMRDAIVNWDTTNGLLIEWTTGPNVPRDKIPLATRESDLLQDAESFVKLLNEGRLSPEHKILIVTTNSSLELREGRNFKRPDPMEPEDFRNIFPDGGELTKAFASQLSPQIRIIDYPNNYDDEGRFHHESRDLCFNELPLFLEGAPWHQERGR